VRHDITRRIWGDGDAVLMVFAGAAAEFALSRAVDWLFVTGNLPKDPVGRLFSTVSYARSIAFDGPDAARAALERIRTAHKAVEAVREAQIPPWAYRAVLYLLIDYSERAHSVLGRGLSPAEQEGLFADFRRIGEGLDIPDLPSNYAEWCADRALQLRRDLAWSEYSADLYAAYRRDLGPFRYRVLLEVQGALVPSQVRHALPFPLPNRGKFLIDGYRVLRATPLASPIRKLLFPPANRAQMQQLFDAPAESPTAPGEFP
jgi:uncharacterized protein (DUF2236 family)